MTPPQIIACCAALGLALVAVCDHNSCANAAAFIQAARGTDVTVLPGMELATQEEVHLLCVFPDLNKALQFDQQVQKRLPPLRNRAELFGHQLLLDSLGRVIGEQRALLLAASSLGLEEAWQAVELLGGLVIPAHVDRPSFSILAQLGLLPSGVRFGALELSQGVSRSDFLLRYPSLTSVPLVHGSDAHRLSELYAPRLSVACMEKPTLAELRFALLGEGDRRVVTDLLESSLPKRSQ